MNYRLLTILVVGVLMTLGSLIHAQGPLDYPSMHHYRYETDPMYQQLTDAFEEQILRSTLDGSIAIPRNVHTIPVVVHVMHLEEDSLPTYGSSNPTDNQIRQALKWINEAFRDSGHYALGPQHSNAVHFAKNNDGSSVSLDVDTYIEFQLARSTPDSLPTIGILRHASPFSDFELEGSCVDANGNVIEEEFCLKSNAWDSKYYLNIWLVNSICQLDGENCATEGFSYGGSMSGMPLDGMVLEARLFDTTEVKVSKAVHNIGHYLGLFDTYLNGCDQKSTTDSSNSCLVLGDKICDTPPDNYVDVGTCSPVSRVNSCDNDTKLAGTKFIEDAEDLFENFMDGGDPACKNSFTEGQRARMVATLFGSRIDLLNSFALQNFVTDLGIDRVNHPGPVLCGNRVSPQVIIKNYGTRSISQARIRLSLNNQLISDEDWKGNLPPGQTASFIFPSISNLDLDIHNYEIEILNVNGLEEDQNSSNDRFKGSFVSVNPFLEENNFPYCVDFEGTFPYNWSRGDQDGVINFELYNDFPTCPSNHGSNYLMYNSSGAWDNGQGVKASDSGTRDFLVSPLLDFTQENQAIMTFDLAHKTLTEENELTLKIWVVRDCDAKPILVFERTGQELETSSTPADTGIVGWRPEACEDWQNFQVNLDTFVATPFRVFFEAEINNSYIQNFYLDNICFRSENECELPTAIPTVQGIYKPNFYCTDTAGWTHYYRNRALVDGIRKDLLLFSVKGEENGEALVIPPTEAQLVLAKGRDSMAFRMQGLAPYAENLRGWNVMNRYLRIKDAGQPSDSFMVRFYYDETDFQDVQRAIAPEEMISRDFLVFYSITADKEVDPETGHQGIESVDFQEYRSRFLDGPSGWKGGESNDGFYYADLKVGRAYAIGAGSGGYGRGYGAKYPVGPKYLKAEQEGAFMNIRWETRREYLTKEFEIYYSDDSLDFSLWEVESAQRRPYLYERNQADLDFGKYYYYVKIIHDDGLELVSDTISAVFDPRAFINVYPNPSRRKIYIKINTENDSDVSFAIYDGAGYRKLLSYEWLHQNGRPAELDISALPNGIFFYVIRFNGIEYRDKIIKLR